MAYRVSTSDYRAAVLVVALLAAAVAGGRVLQGQEIGTKFNSGQSVQPAFEGWSRNPNGSYDLWFGYLNRNYKETPNVPIGPNNGFGAGGEDLGQPTHFAPRRQEFAFKVTVPADWPKDRDVVWTLNVNGTELKAFGSLWPVWEIDEKIMSANNGGRTARLDGEPVNLAPTIATVLPDQTAVVGQPLSLTLGVADDGMPKPAARPAARSGGSAAGAAAGTSGGSAPAPFDPETNATNRQLRVKWMQWRGPGTVRFTPQIAAVLGGDGKPVTYAVGEAPVKALEGKATTKVTFDKPGAYTLRAYAMDPDAFMTIQDFKVTVN